MNGCDCHVAGKNEQKDEAIEASDFVLCDAWEKCVGA